MSLAWAARKIGLGLRPDEDLNVPVSDWLTEQMSAKHPDLTVSTVTTANPQIVEWPETLEFSIDERIRRLVDFTLVAAELDRANLSDDERNNQRYAAYLDRSVLAKDVNRFVNSAIYSRSHLQKRLIHFWLNHFTVGDGFSTVGEMIGDYISVISDALDGNFNDLLYRATSHPAMLSYLDNVANIGERSPKGLGCRESWCVVGINDNLARELMELHSVSPARDYTEDDIRGAAEILAGWGDHFEHPWVNGPVPASWYEAWVPFHAEPGTKTVLGRTFPEGKGALRQLTDHLAADDFTPRFLALKLSRHFIGEDASDADRSAIESAWIDSGGHLPTVHRVVFERALESPAKKYLWPSTWFFQANRLSGAKLVRGYDELHAMDHVLRDAHEILTELGNDFWATRQPNGFSDLKADWVSTEHMDRRFRFATIIHRYGKPELEAEEIIARHGFSAATAELVAHGRNATERFVLLTCSPEFMEV